MDEPTKRGGAAVVAMALAAVLLLPLLYVLSVGPVAWMANSGRLSQSWMRGLETAYWPLEWAAENVPVVGPAIVSYVGLWVPDDIQVAPPTATGPATATVKSGS